MVPVGGQERCLVNAQGPDRPDPARVVDEWGAMSDHCVHHRPPAHSQLPGHLRHGAGQLADLAGCFAAGVHRDHRPTWHRRHGLGPGPSVAIDLAATPPPFQPHQSGRTAETGQIPDVHPQPIMGLGPHPALRAPSPISDGFHRHDHLGRVFGHLQDLESVQSQKCLSQPRTRRPSSGIPFVRSHEQPRRLRDP